MTDSTTATATPTPTYLRIRPATLAASDHELLIDLKDSHIEWLSTIGSIGQWGRTPSREANPSISSKTRAWIERSERQAAWGGGSVDVDDDDDDDDDNGDGDGDGKGAWCRAFVAENKTSGAPVAALVLEAQAAAYVGAVLPEQDKSDPFVYVAYLISDRRRAGEERTGAGAALIALAVEQSRRVGVRRLCLDCYRGNDRKLVRYYESQGFKPLGDFSAPVPGKDDWLGCVLEMRW